MELKSLDQLSLVVWFLLPGVVIVYVRAQFLTGRLTPHKDALLTYLALSLVYHALTLPLLSALLRTQDPLAKHPWLWLLTVFFGPAAVGVVFGLNASKDWSRRFLAKLGLRGVHPMPTAWDETFARSEARLVIVTLKDGSVVRGWCGQQSFISSDAKERDIYIEQIYHKDEQGAWGVLFPGTGVYIAPGEIRMVEFPPQP